MNNKLKPCPFCGGEAKFRDSFMVTPIIDENGAYIDADVSDDRPYWIECTLCRASAADADIEEEAIKAWNRRVDNGNL